MAAVSKDAQDERALDLLRDAMQINVVPRRCDARENAWLLPELRVRHRVVPSDAKAVALVSRHAHLSGAHGRFEAASQMPVSDNAPG